MKDPAFLFYPNDYIGGTMGLTFEEKGAYMELLMMQFNRGHMTSHMIGQVVGQLWINIEDKFEKDEDGLYFNKRLEEEQIKRKRFADSRRNNKKGTNQYSKKVGHMTSHMEDEDINRNKVLSSYKKIYEKLKIELIVPDEFDSIIIKWLKYKSELGKSYKETGLKQFINKLIKLSNNNFETAKEITEQSMANNWAGIFKINNDEKNRTNNKGFQSDTTKRTIEQTIQELREASK